MEQNAEPEREYTVARSNRESILGQVVAGILLLGVFLLIVFHYYPMEWSQLLFRFLFLGVGFFIIFRDLYRKLTTEKVYAGDCPYCGEKVEFRADAFESDPRSIPQKQCSACGKRVMFKDEKYWRCEAMDEAVDEAVRECN